MVQGREGEGGVWRQLLGFLFVCEQWKCIEDAQNIGHVQYKHTSMHQLPIVVGCPLSMETHDIVYVHVHPCEVLLYPTLFA